MVGFVLVAVVAGGWLIVARVSAASVKSKSAQLASVLGLSEGSRVADVGAGKGQLALELARLVGPTGHGFATEINGKRRQQIRSAAARAGLQHLSVVVATEVDTGLEPSCCDAILMRSVYHQCHAASGNQRKPLPSTAGGWSSGHSGLPARMVPVDVLPGEGRSREPSRTWRTSRGGH